ncbi:MAG: NAD-dependent epimerase/dehydratase family protein [Lachnospiraceae bacterium]|nr:NAD-dependent epimerase/dehydratase family protein [Lachnospiraceae bacterium]
MKILVTGGTVFVSKYVAQYYVNKGYEVYVLNRNSRPQVEGVHLLEADRHNCREILKGHYFDAVLDVTAYTAGDIKDLLAGLEGFGQYIMISSSAVYPETNVQPFTEGQSVGLNKFWGQYGTDKIAAEEALLQAVPNAYVIRPPYLYGPMNNVYREAFVYECAEKERKFYIPKDGSMQLQFFHVEDLCKVMDAILEKEPAEHILNVGNEETVSILDWVKMCYDVVGAPLEIVNVDSAVEQRKYFSFYDYEYKLEVSRQKTLLDKTTDLCAGLKDAYEWYKSNKSEVRRKDFIAFIDEKLV